jgi:hypothetical protein
MLPDFATWMYQLDEAAPVAANFFNVVAQPEDFIYFDVHGLKDFDPAHPLDIRKMTPFLGKVIGYAGDGKVTVTPPQQHRFKSQSIKTDRAGNWVVQMNQVHEITSRLLAGGGFDVNSHTKEPRKLFLYTPKPYHMMLLSQANKMMSAHASEKQAQQGPQMPNVTDDEVARTRALLFGDEEQKPAQTNLSLRTATPSAPLAAKVQNRGQVPNPHSADPSDRDPLRDMFSAKQKPVVPVQQPPLRQRMIMPAQQLKPTGTMESYKPRLIGESSRPYYSYFKE